MSLTPGSPFDLDVDAPLDEPGALLGDRYRILEVHRGGMGEVFIVRTLDDDTPIALKSFQKRLFFDRDSRQAFLREAAIWMRLTGEPHVMPALGLAYLDDRPFVYMPVVRTSVRDLLVDGPLPAENAVAIAFQTALGMESAARRLGTLVHGDIKPENLLVGDGGVLVSDFGLARAADSDRPTALETTWAYRAPESRSSAELSSATDVYAYGVLLFELLTGSRPFAASTRAEWERAHLELPPPSLDYEEGSLESVLAALACQSLARDPDARPSFDTIFRELNERLHDVNAGLALMLIHNSFELKEELARVGEATRDQHARDLIRIGEHELALEELTARPEGERTVSWHVSHGDVLSLLGRDEEALASLEAAAGAPEATQEERRAALGSLGLSLKRLERFDGALEVFEALRREAPEEELAGTLVNLATVHLERGDPQSAAALLQPVAPAYPDLPELWANLGLAYEDLGDPASAINAYRHALRAGPHMPELHVFLARVLMEGYGAVADAALALDLAFQQGFDDREWYVRTRACCLLLGNEREAADQAEALKRTLGPERVDELNAEAAVIIDRVRKRGTSP